MTRLSKHERTLFKEPKQVYVFIVLDKEQRPYIVYDNLKATKHICEERGFTWTTMGLYSKYISGEV